MLECCSVNQAMFRSSRKILDGSFGLRSNLAWYFWHRHHFQLKIWHQKVLTQYLWWGLMFVIFLTPKSFDTIPVMWVDVCHFFDTKKFWHNTCGVGWCERAGSELNSRFLAFAQGLGSTRGTPVLVFVFLYILVFLFVFDYHCFAGFLTGSRLALL